MADVVAIHGGSIPLEPDADIVGRLEDMLALAKAGTLRAIAYGLVTADGSKSTGWSGSAGTRDAMSSCILVLHQRYGKALADP